jgi:hypothetical protein
MIEFLNEFVTYSGWIVVGLIIVAAIMNKDVISDARKLSKSVKTGTGMAVDKAANFFDGDGDGDIDIDDLKFIVANVKPVALVAAIRESKKAEGYRNDGIPYAPKTPVAQLFEEAVNKKSGEE